MDYYGAVLRATHHLLTRVKADDWAKRIANDIIYWNAENSVEHYLNAFGDRESITEVVLGADKGHKITNEQEVWANTLLSALSMIGSRLAKSNQTDELAEIEEIMQSFASIDRNISGYRCKKCGYSEVSEDKVNYYIAPLIVSKEILKELVSNDFIKVVNNCLEMSIPEIEIERSRLRTLINESSITYTSKEKTMDICAKCGKENIIECKWREKRNKGFLSSKEKTVLAIVK